MKYLAIVAIIKNEAPYLAEWLDFHRKQGVEHFYIYDNDSEDNPDIEYPDITYEKVSGSSQQNYCYQSALNKYGKLFTWIAFIDVDEFLYSPLQTLPKVLKNYEHFGGIAVKWYLYGSNGHLVYNSIPVLERFTKRSRYVDKHVKSIVQPSRVLSVGKDPHTFYFKPRYYAVNERKMHMPQDYAVTEGGSGDILRINHYHVKSREEYFKRRLLPDANTGILKDPNVTFSPHDVNQVLDDSILKYR